MQFYQLKSWPYVGIIDPRTGECLCEYHHVAQDSFCDVLLTFLTANPWDRHENSRQVPRLASLATGNMPCDNITTNHSEVSQCTRLYLKHFGNQDSFRFGGGLFRQEGVIFLNGGSGQQCRLAAGRLETLKNG